MCAFYHKPEEKTLIEQEAESFFDPIIRDEDFESEGEYSPDYGEGEYDSNEGSRKSNHSNSNTNTNIFIPEVGETYSETDLHDKFPLQTDNIFSEEESMKGNAWENEDFVLEEAMKKASSYNPIVDFEAKIDKNDSQSFPDIYEEQKYDLSPNFAKPTKEAKMKEQAKVEKEVSNEIKNIAIGNNQQMDTSKIVKNIMSQNPSGSKSKFFNIEDAKENEEDLINEIYHMDYNTQNIDLSSLSNPGPNLLNTSPAEMPIQYFENGLIEY